MGKNGIKALGVDLSYIFNSLSYFGLLARRIFPHAILDVSDISRTIDILQRRGVRFVSLYARISPDNIYFFEQKEKSCETAAAILYDFIDGFIVSDFGNDIAKVVDPLLNLRLINDEYRQLFLALPMGCTESQLTNMINYVLYSDIDGLIVNDEAQFDYIYSRYAGRFRIFVNNIERPSDYDSIIDKGADAAFVKVRSKLAVIYVMKGIWIRLKSKKRK